MSAGRCPSCGEYDLKWIRHSPEDVDEDDTHTYCINCDWGLCERCE